MSDAMILESVVTSTGISGTVNIAPMGPQVSRDFEEIVLKPFKSSTTYQNLALNGRAVVHVVDDVLLIARSAINKLDNPPVINRFNEHWHVLEDACHWYAVEVDRWTEDALRPEASCRIVDSNVQRPFFGFNRAKHAVIELAILATRVGLLPREKIESEMAPLGILVDKTGGAQEHEAFGLLKNYIEDCFSSTGNQTLE